MVVTTLPHSLRYFTVCLRATEHDIGDCSTPVVWPASYGAAVNCMAATGVCTDQMYVASLRRNFRITEVYDGAGKIEEVKFSSTGYGGVCMLY